MLSITRLTFLGALHLAALISACDRSPRQAGAQGSPAYVDSIFPIDEGIRRFRAALPEPAERLSGGADSKDELVTRFLKALETLDSVALAELTITAAEFAYLYYPSSRFTSSPYEMSPALLWFQLQNYGSRGLSRALGRYGGKLLRSAGVECSEDPAVEGDNRIWPGCAVRLITESGDTVNLAILGPILEREGRFKFLNYANRL